MRDPGVHRAGDGEQPVPGARPVFQRLLAGQQRPAAVVVELVEGADQHLHGLADLPAEGLGDLLLPLQAFQQQPGQRVGVGHREEPGPVQQRHEGLQRLGLLAPQARVPDCRPGGTAAGAHTSAHHRPSVTSPTGTSRARSSTASRSTGLAVQPPAVMRARGWAPHGA